MVYHLTSIDTGCVTVLSLIGSCGIWCHVKITVGLDHKMHIQSAILLRDMEVCF